jgi:hypothetical protein
MCSDSPLSVYPAHADEEFVNSVTLFAEEMFSSIPGQRVTLPMTYAAPMRMCARLPIPLLSPIDRSLL